MKKKFARIPNTQRLNYVNPKLSAREMDHGSDIWKIKKRKVKPTNLLHQYQMGQFQNIDIW